VQESEVTAAVKITVWFPEGLAGSWVDGRVLHADVNGHKRLMVVASHKELAHQTRVTLQTICRFCKKPTVVCRYFTGSDGSPVEEYCEEHERGFHQDHGRRHGA
jgi:hypothetical protein